MSLPWFDAHPYQMQESRFSLEQLFEGTGVRIEDLNRRNVDYGIQKLFTSHEPWVFSEPFTPEPPESTTKEDLSRFAEIATKVIQEVYSNPEIRISTPHNCSISKATLNLQRTLTSGR